jgi:hypothetical protein
VGLSHPYPPWTGWSRLNSKSKVKATLLQGEIFNFAIGRAAWEACSTTWNLGTNSGFALGRRKTRENLDRVGRSQDLPDANWLLVSSPTLKPRTLTLISNLCCCVFLCFSFFSNKLFFYNYLYVHKIWISTKPYITHMEGINVYVNKYAYEYIYIYIYVCVCVCVCVCDSLITVKFGSLL